MEDKVEKSKDKKKTKEDKLYFKVIDSKGDTVRRYARKIDEKGLIRTSWNLRVDGVRAPSRREVMDDDDLPGGNFALPGEYTMLITYGDWSDQITTTVHMDPRLEMSQDEMSAMVAAGDDFNQVIKSATESYAKVAKAKKSIALIEKLTETLSDSTKTMVGDLTKKEKKNIEALELLFFNKENQKGIQRNPDILTSKLFGARRYIGSSYGAPGANAQIADQKARTLTDQVVKKVDQYMDGDWKIFKEAIDAIQFKIFD